MNIRDLLKFKDAKIHRTTRDTRLSHAIDSLNYYNIGALLVLDGKKLEGIVTERDILHALSRHREKFVELKVGDIMTRNVVTCQAEDTIGAVMNKMSERHFRHIPVMDSNILLGIISIGDIIKGILQQPDASYFDKPLNRKKKKLS
jgi:CBS domain-containing protein